jgi:hypothetical protein
MRLPHLKEIVFSKNDKAKYEHLLKNVDNRSNPYLINLLNFDEIEHSFIEKIENFILKKCKSLMLPYPIYALTNLKEYRGKIQTLYFRKDIPDFYLDQNKTILRSHAKIAKLNSISERKFEFNDYDEFKKNMKQYKETTRKFHITNLESRSLDFIIERIKEND